MCFVILNSWNTFHTWARQWFGSRLCLHADLQGGTKATDAPGHSEPETPGSAGGTPAAHSRLCKYFSWAGAFLKQNPEPTAVTPTAGTACCLSSARPVCTDWSGWNHPGVFRGHLWGESPGTAEAVCSPWRVPGVSSASVPVQRQRVSRLETGAALVCGWLAWPSGVSWSHLQKDPMCVPTCALHSPLSGVFSGVSIRSAERVEQKPVRAGGRGVF